MKSIVYHYVRPSSGGLPHFRYLPLREFQQQLNWFQSNEGVLSRNEFMGALEATIPSKGVVLTFDDALRDHITYVFPELKRRNLWAIFYVPTGIYRTCRLSHVHRVHFLVGKYGIEMIFRMLAEVLDDEMIKRESVDAYESDTYRYQDTESKLLYIKRVLNFYLEAETRDFVLDTLMSRVGIDETALFNSYYLSLDEIRTLSDAGMEIGSHGVSHTPFSNLSIARQEEEIEESVAFLNSVTNGDIITFCYPYGGRHSYSSETVSLLDKSDLKYSFDVQARNISAKDIRLNIHMLPRYDCNQFPHGISIVGDVPSDTSVTGGVGA